MVFYSLTAAMSIILTGMICVKLLSHKRQMVNPAKAFKDNGVTYITIVGVLIESAAVYSGTCLIYVILTATSSPAAAWFGGVLSAASVSEPFLFNSQADLPQFLCQSWIILRVAMGYSYEARRSSHWSSRPYSAFPSTGHAPDTLVSGSGSRQERKLSSA
jgi:hypothetical protein